MFLFRKISSNLAKERRYVVEVRNKKLLDNSFYSMLKANGVGLAWVDSVSMQVSLKSSRISSMSDGKETGKE